jgi:hypothetical protein
MPQVTKLNLTMLTKPTKQAQPKKQSQVQQHGSPIGNMTLPRHRAPRTMPVGMGIKLSS